MGNQDRLQIDEDLRLLFESFPSMKLEQRAAAVPEVLAKLPLYEQAVSKACDSDGIYDYVLVADALATAEVGLPEAEANRVLSSALRLCVECEDFPMAAYVGNKLAKRLEVAGEIDRALEVLRPVLKESARAGIGGANCAVLASKLAVSLGRLTEALEFVDTGLRIAGESGPEPAGDSVHHLRAYLHGQRVEVLLELSLAHAANRHLDLEKQSAEASSSDPEKLHVAPLLHRLDSFLAFQMHRRLENKARTELAKSWDAGDRALIELRLAIGLADLEYAIHDSARAREARELFEGLLRRSEEEDFTQALRCETWLLELDIREGLLNEARERSARLLAEFEETTIGEHNRPMTDLRSLFAGLRARLHLALAPSLDAEARESMLVNSRFELQREFEGMLTRWEANTPLREAGIAFLGRRSRRLVVSQLIQHEHALRSKREEAAATALEYVLRIQEMGTFARQANFQSRSLDQVQEALCDDDHGLLVYLPSDAKGHLFCIGSKSVEHVEVAGEDEWQGPRERLEDLLRSRPDAGVDEIRAASMDLGKALLPLEARKVISDVGWKAVSVVGGDLLGYVPFEYLPGVKTRWLYQELDVSYLRSLPVGVLLAERSTPVVAEDALDLHLVLANRALKPHFPFESTHRALLTGAFEGRSTRIDSGDKATLGSLEKRLGHGDRLLHLVAHGELREGELRPAVALAGQSRLDPKIVKDWKGAPRLVLLSVCRAALGVERPGDDVPIDLGSAYLAAGSQAVILPRLKVEYEAQAALAFLIEKHLLRGESPARALSLARDELARDERFAHPKHGLMHVVGLGHQPVFEAR